MNKSLVLASLIWFSANTFAVERREGNISNLLANIIASMPGENSYAFVVPTTGQQDTFALVTNAILNGHYDHADSIAGSLGYIVYEWYDTGQNGDRYYILMEPEADRVNGVKKGWGTFMFRPENTNNAIIEVPHPLHDYNTWRVGLSAYRYLRVQYFIMAGTHRYANGTEPRPADVAHNSENMFHTVHQCVSPYSQHSLQIHGFSRSDYPDVVLSNGTATPPQILSILAKNISDQGFTVGVYDGVNYSAYGATTNIQGQWSRSMGYSFMHMELERYIRESIIQYNKILVALDTTFYISTSLEFQIGTEPLNTCSLSQNYPNPCNPTTSIKAFLPHAGYARLMIYDQLGRRIITLANSNLHAGNQVFVWAGNDEFGNPVSSGTYYCLFQFEHQKQIKKMILIR